MKVALNISLILIVVFFLTPHSQAQYPSPDGIIKIYDSTFEEFADSLGTIRESGTHPIKKTVCFVGCVTITLCSGEWAVNISNLDFTITTGNINITGQVSGTYNCWITIPFPGTVSASSIVTYSESQRAIRIDIDSLSINVPILGTINIPSLSPSESFPVNTAYFYFETAIGPEWLRLSPYNVSLTQRNGYIELQGNAVLW